jgi:hypothetical protein
MSMLICLFLRHCRLVPKKKDMSCLSFVQGLYFLGCVPVHRHNDRLMSDRVVRGDNIPHPAMQNRYPLANVPREMRQGKVLSRRPSHRRGFGIGVEGPPAIVVQNLPVDPGGRPEPPKIQHQVASQLLSRRVVFAVLAVPKLLTVARREAKKSASRRPSAFW